MIVSFGKGIRFSLFEKLEGTKNSFFEFDKKDAHQEKVLLLKIANFADLIILKSFLIESEFLIDICKSGRNFLRSFITLFPYLLSSEITTKVFNPLERAYSIDFL